MKWWPCPQVCLLICHSGFIFCPLLSSQWTWWLSHFCCFCWSMHLSAGPGKGWQGLQTRSQTKTDGQVDCTRKQTSGQLDLWTNKPADTGFLKSTWNQPSWYTLLGCDTSFIPHHLAVRSLSAGSCTSFDAQLPSFDCPNTSILYSMLSGTSGLVTRCLPSFLATRGPIVERLHNVRPSIHSNINSYLAGRPISLAIHPNYTPRVQQAGPEAVLPQLQLRPWWPSWTVLHTGLMIATFHYEVRFVEGAVVFRAIGVRLVLEGWHWVPGSQGTGLQGFRCPR